MTALPKRTADEVAGAWPVFRQSMLSDMDACPLALRFRLEGYPTMGPEAARGVVFHLFMEKYLQTLRDTQERKMPPQEAIEVLREAEAQLDVPDEEFVHVPASERELLRICAFNICRVMLATERIVGVERRLFANVSYPGQAGSTVERTVSGKPDVLIADPPDGLIVPDWKTTRSPPAKSAESRNREGNDALSPEGWFQQRMYALLVWRTFPNVERVTLREFYVPKMESRDAVLERWRDLEHVEREVGMIVGELDRALAGGHDSPLWAPQPGRHCRYCPRPMDCPIDLMEREVAAPLTPEQATELAAAYLVADRQRKWLRETLRSHAGAHGPVDVRSDRGDYQMRWKLDAGGGRRFGLFPSDTEEAA